MKKTLLVDLNRASVPSYRHLVEKGHDVWVVGKAATEPLAKLSDNYVELDYSDEDHLSRLIEQENFDFVIPGCTDLSYSTVAKVNQGRFPGIDPAGVFDLINSKQMFRQKLDDLGIPSPKVWDPRSTDIQGNVVVKPVDSFSGRGIIRLENPSSAQIREAYDNACASSSSGKTLVEEYVTGQLYSYSAFLCEGKILADFVVQEDCTTYPYAVDTSKVAWGFPVGIRDSLGRDILTLAQHLGMQDGLVHTQLIFDGNSYWIIEMTRRCPGDLYSLLIEFSTGYPYAASYVAPFIGESPAPARDDLMQSYIIRHTATSKEGESLWGFQFSRPVSIRLFVPLAMAGDRIGASPYGRAALFFLETQDAVAQEGLYQSLLGNQLYGMGMAG